jgi:lipopolysaccharide/colanic/teichoic acid biosynthesis glycosyltransferase
MRGDMRSNTKDKSKVFLESDTVENLMAPGRTPGNGNGESDTMPTLRSAFSRLWRTIVMRMKIRSWQLVVASREPAKRVFDIVGALFFIILLSPVFVVTYLIIRLQDGGPAIFAQTRVGKWGKPFKFYKFRSMVMNAEDLKSQLMRYNEMKGVTFKMVNDPRITPFGRIIRKFSIDELPQLFNVLKGDMSLVGPRPPLPLEVGQYSNQDLYRLHSTPGITCIWQVSGRNKIQFKDQVKLDMQYIHKRTMWQDIKILIQTAKAVITARGAS